VSQHPVEASREPRPEKTATEGWETRENGRKLSKNLVKARALVEPRPYLLVDAVPLLQKAKYAKFDETVDLTMRLGVDPKHADQMVRGTVVLPHGLGKSKIVAVIASGDKVKDAQAAGAEFFGGEELVEKIQKENWTAFDALIATPDMMKSVGRLGKVLGPKGLMPNPKTGTVTTDVAGAVKEIKAGKVEFRTDKTALVHVPVGKLYVRSAEAGRQRDDRHHECRQGKAFGRQGQVHQGCHAQLHDGPRHPARLRRCRVGRQGLVFRFSSKNFRQH